MENGGATPVAAADEVARLLAVIDIQNELAAAALDLDEIMAAVVRSAAQRYRLPLSVVLFDLDGFKRVNDEDGHPAGDAVLCHVAQALRNTRQSDDCYRIGGDEFALVLANTPADGATIVAERVAAEVAELNRSTGVTTSLGIGALASGSAHELHARADEQLLAAKRPTRAR